ncbi:MAG: hypothetical protein ABFC63_05905 [Thermoguttaceae bacterium]
MPKAAATITGLVLAAGSIGFNTIRYPVVSDMVGTTLAAVPSGDSPQTAPTALPAPADLPADIAKSEKDSPVDVATGRSAAPIPKVDVKPVPDMAREIAEPTATVADPAEKPKVAANESVSLPNAEKPLVPVSAVSATSNGDLGGGVRRLPPIDRDRPAPAVGWPTDGQMPIYPSTGIR